MPNKPIRIMTPAGVMYQHDISTDSLVFNVADYGAVGDNATDDTESLQSAITAALSVNGVVALQSGKNYKISSKLSLTAEIGIIGNYSKITQTGNDNVLYITSSDVKIEKLKIIVPGTNTASVIKIYGATDGYHFARNNMRDIAISATPYNANLIGIEVNLANTNVGYLYSLWDTIDIYNIGKQILFTGSGWATANNFRNLLLQKYYKAFESTLTAEFTGNNLDIQFSHQTTGSTSTAIKIDDGQGNRINGTLWRETTGTMVAFELGASTSFNHIKGEFDGDSFINSGTNNKFDYWKVGTGWATS